MANILVGYARVSTQDQNLALQRDALNKAGCSRIFEDTMSGAKVERPGLDKALDVMREGDTLVVWRLDRLGRSLKHLIETVQMLEQRGVGFKSVQENIDTTTPGGKLVFHIFAALAEFERELIRERTNAGLQAARVRGKTGGRKRILSGKQIAQARLLAGDPANSVPDICKTFNISRTTYYREVHLKPQPVS